jgi:hypothetical protein
MVMKKLASLILSLIALITRDHRQPLHRRVELKLELGRLDFFLKMKFGISQV